MRAFIIGNGPSRNGFELSKLKGKGTIYGCNGLYRDFRPDYLIAIDPPMIEEIRQSSFPQHRFIVPPPHEQVEMSGTGKRSNSGMNAMYEAIKRGNTHLFIFGLDFIFKKKVASLGNIYGGTVNYGNPATYEDNLNRVIYMRWFARKFSDVQFTFVLPDDKSEVHDMEEPNINGLYYQQLDRIL